MNKIAPYLRSLRKIALYVLALIGASVYVFMALDKLGIGHFHAVYTRVPVTCEIGTDHGNR